MRTFIWLITCCFHFFASGHLAGADLTDRVNQTVQLGNAFGVEVDSTIAFDQLKTLSPNVFRAEFQTFADLNPSNVKRYAGTFPEEFWALNQYLSQLYRGGFITPDTLSDLRAASVQGLAKYQSTITPKDFEPQTVTSQAATPELDRFVEIARQVQSGQSLAEIARDSTERVVERVIQDEGREQLSFLFPNAKLETQVFSEDGPEISAGFITSIVENESSNVFGQTTFSTNPDGSKLSMGIGYRTLDPTGSQVLGANAFIDYDIDEEHTRGSVGVEAQNNFISGTANRYFSLSDYRLNEDRMMKKPADGYDARLEMAIPFFPGLFATYQMESWDRGEDGNDRRESIGLKGEITPNLVLSLENRTSTTGIASQNSGSLTYTYKPDGNTGTIGGYREPLTVFNEYKHRFVERDGTMPLASKLQNEPPVAQDFAEVVAVNRSVDIDVAELIGDPDSDSLTVTATDGLMGATSVSGTVITYTPNNSVAQSSPWQLSGFGFRKVASVEPTQAFSGMTDAFSYTVFDGNGGESTGTITVALEPPNGRPTAGNGTLTVLTKEPVNIDVAPLISDPDDDPLSVSVTDGSAGTTTISGTIITYSPDEFNPGAADFFPTPSTTSRGMTAKQLGLLP